VRGLRKLLGSKFIKQADSNSRDHIQRLSPENKGGLLYIPFREGYRNGVYLVSYMVTCYFLVRLNLWDKVTLLWSHPR
jgi:hypothetical protein